MDEIWKDVKGYEGLYEISNKGNVKSLNYNKTGIEKELKQAINTHGYCFVQLSNRKKKLIHRLVADAFIPNTDNLPQVNHKDENKLNNCAENLEWCTAEYNTNYGTCIKRRSDKQKGKSRYWQNKQIVAYKDGTLYKEYKSITDAANDIGCKMNQISEHLNRPLRHKTVKGFVFKYKEVA